MTRKPRLRATEVLLILYFGYVAVTASAFAIEKALLAWLVFAGITTVLILLAQPADKAFSVARDWIPLGLLLCAYREMDWFAQPQRRTDLELLWERWDVDLLIGWHWQRAIEFAGGLIPASLELCYFLVYAVGAFTVAALYFERHRRNVDRTLVLVLAGTLLSYALFPYFPTAPPRRVFAEPSPAIVTPIRQFNLWIVNGAGITSSVFPSAHVSGAFSAAFALIMNLPRRRRWKWWMLLYASSVVVAAVYGRYHYVADAAAGIGISLAACLIVLTLFRLRPRARRAARP